VREKCVLSTPVTSPLKPPLLWGRLRPKERRFDRSYVFQWLLWDYVLGAFLPSLLGWCRDADPVINIGPAWPMARPAPAFAFGLLCGRAPRGQLRAAGRPAAPRHRTHPQLQLPGAT
jgi:hypothetical protein